MAAYKCNLQKTPTGGTTAWTPPKPAGFNIGDTITFGSAEGVWNVKFTNSPFDPVPLIRDFGGQPNEERMGQLVRSGTFPCDCSLNVGGQSVNDWNGPGGKGDDVKIPPPPGN